MSSHTHAQLGIEQSKAKVNSNYNVLFLPQDAVFQISLCSQICKEQQFKCTQRGNKKKIQDRGSGDILEPEREGKGWS